MSKSSDLGVWQTSQKGDYCVHHILIINYAILTLSNQDSNKFTKVWTKFFPLRSRHGKGVITTVLKGIKKEHIKYDIKFDPYFFLLLEKEHFSQSRYGQKSRGTRCLSFCLFWSSTSKLLMCSKLLFTTSI